MARVQILYWHDIPVQVRARDRHGRATVRLPERFMAAVDEAAMAARRTESELYTAGFHWSEPFEREGTAEEVATTVAAELAARYPEIDWRQTAQALRQEGKVT